jgi:hypothetical protein
MDTRFWGPSGWRFLHILTFRAPTIDSDKLYDFFNLLPYALPCKFCRASLADYYAADPIPEDPNKYAHWLYRIHNRVSGKLRDQKLLEDSDPKWEDIRQRYSKWVEAPCTANKMLGWDFLFSVAYTTPTSKTSSSPMYGAPPIENLKTPELLNRWNLLSHQKRIPYIEEWWSLFADILPYETWRAAWKAVEKENGKAPVKKGKHSVTAWLYKMEKGVCKYLNEVQPHGSFEGLCSELSTFSSGCGGKSKRTKTCRATKTHARTTLKKRRTGLYKAVGGFL